MDCDFFRLKQQDIAHAIGVNVKTIRRWSAGGMPRNADQTYNLPSCVQWLLDREKEDETPETVESQRWLTEFRKERALLSRIERQKAEGALIFREEVLRQWAWRVGEVRAGLIAFADRLPPLMEGCSRGEMFEVIFEEVAGLFENFSREGRFCPKSNVKFPKGAPG